MTDMQLRVQQIGCLKFRIFNESNLQKTCLLWHLQVGGCWHCDLETTTAASVIENQKPTAQKLHGGSVAEDCGEVMACICGHSPAPGRESYVCHMIDPVMQLLRAKVEFVEMKCLHVHHLHHLWYKVKRRGQPLTSSLGRVCKGRGPGYKSLPLTL